MCQISVFFVNLVFFISLIERRNFALVEISFHLISVADVELRGRKGQANGYQ